MLRRCNIEECALTSPVGAHFECESFSFPVFANATHSHCAVRLAAPRSSRRWGSKFGAFSRSIHLGEKSGVITPGDYAAIMSGAYRHRCPLARYPQPGVWWTQARRPRAPYEGLAMSSGDGTAAIKKVRYSHEAMIDLIIAHPGISQNQLAAHFGYTPGWVSQVMSSDAFKARLEARKEDIVDPVMFAAVEERFEGLVRESQRVVLEKLGANPTADFALKVLEVSSKALGYGAGVKNQIGEQHNYVVVMPPKVKDAAEWALQHSPRVIEGQASGAAD